MAEKENDNHSLADYLKAVKENNNHDLIKVRSFTVIDSKVFYAFTLYRY